MRRDRRTTQRSNAVLVYLLLLITLQVFLLVVAVEGLLGDDDHLAWISGGFSAALFLTGLGFARFLADG